MDDNWILEHRVVMRGYSPKVRYLILIVIFFYHIKLEMFFWDCI